MRDWDREDQDRAVALRRELAAEIQKSRREGSRWSAWCFDKIANMVLWIEREGKRLMRGF